MINVVIMAICIVYIALYNGKPQQLEGKAKGTLLASHVVGIILTYVVMHTYDSWTILLHNVASLYAIFVAFSSSELMAFFHDERTDSVLGRFRQELMPSVVVYMALGVIGGSYAVVYAIVYGIVVSVRKWSGYTLGGIGLWRLSQYVLAILGILLAYSMQMMYH